MMAIRSGSRLEVSNGCQPFFLCAADMQRSPVIIQAHVFDVAVSFLVLLLLFHLPLLLLLLLDKVAVLDACVLYC
jgi:hypothetical protein